MINNADKILSQIGPTVRDRKVLLWVCKSWDFREGVETQEDSESFTEAYLKYRSEVSDQDKTIADLYWKAVWFEGGRSPVMNALYSKQSIGQLSGRAIVPIASQVDARLSISESDFLPLFILQGLLDEKAPIASRYGGLGTFSRLMLAWDLACQLERYQEHALIVIGATRTSDLQILFRVLNERTFIDLKLVIAGTTTFSLPDVSNSGISIFRWEEPVSILFRELTTVGLPPASQIPKESIRLGDMSVSIEERVTSQIDRVMKVLTVAEVTAPATFSTEDLVAFFKGDIDNWNGYSAGAVVIREPLSNSQDSAISVVRHHLERLRDSKSAPSSVYIQLPSEDGSGATTIIRSIAYRLAKEGYPTLVLRPGCSTLDAELLKAFATELADAALQHDIPHIPPLLLVFDVEHGKDLNIPHILQSLATAGRNVVALHATKIIDSSTNRVNPHKHNRKITLNNLTAYASPADISGCLQTFGELVRDWHLPLGVPSLNSWNRYEKASQWHTVDDSEHSATLFWVALRFFLVEQADFRTAESLLNALGEFIERRTGEIEDEQLQLVTRYVALLSSFRIPCPLWTALRPIYGERFPSHLSKTITALEAILEWLPVNQEIGDQMLRFRHPAFALEYLRRSNLTDGGSRLQALQPLISAMSPGSAGDCWIAETIASSVLAPKFAEGNSIPLTSRLSLFQFIPEAIANRSKIILHHWARSLYHVADDRRSITLSEDQRLELLLQSIEKIQAALVLPQMDGRDEHPSHLFNTAGTAYARLAQFHNQHSRTVDSQNAWESANKAFRQSLFLSANTNVEALIAFSSRLLDHVRSEPEGSNSLSIDELDDVANALSLLKEAREAYKSHSDPDDSWWEQILIYEAKAHSLLNPEQVNSQVEALKSTDKAELAYFILAHQVYESSHGSDQVERALSVLQEFASTGKKASERLLLFWLSLLHAMAIQKARFDFQAERQLRIQLEQSQDYSRRPIDLFRHAVLCYQVGAYAEGANRFRQLRENMQSGGGSQLNVRDFWRDVADPLKPRLTTVRVTRYVTDWRAEGYVQDLQQSVRLSPKHFIPPLKINGVGKCVIRFTPFGPLAVPPRLEDSYSSD